MKNNTARRALLKCLTEPRTTREIAELITYSRPHVAVLVRRAFDDGLLTRSKLPKAGPGRKQYIYERVSKRKKAA